MDDMTDFDLLCFAIWMLVVTPGALWLVSKLLAWLP
jgi:hypothetical protein